MKHIPHLFLPGPWEGETLQPDPDQIAHVERVLRIEQSAPVTYTDGAGCSGRGQWLGAMIARGAESTHPRPSRLVVAVAPPANRDRVRFLVEKVSELGVESLVWLRTRHGEGRLPSEKRLRAWSVSALEQSRGAWLTRVSVDLVDWDDLPEPLAVCVPDGDADAPGGVRTVAIGPEGGFDSEEIPASAAHVTLGVTILRVETAAVVAAVRFS